jgi:hypothetical protein
VPIQGQMLNLNASRPEVRASTRVSRPSFRADSGPPKAHRRSAPSRRVIGPGCSHSLHQSLPPQSVRRRGQEGYVNEYRQNTLAHCSWRVGCIVRHRLRSGRPDQQADPPPPASSDDGTGLETLDHCPSSGHPAGSGPPIAPPLGVFEGKRGGVRSTPLRWFAVGLATPTCRNHPPQRSPHQRRVSPPPAFIRCRPSP